MRVGLPSFHIYYYMLKLLGFVGSPLMFVCGKDNRITLPIVCDDKRSPYRTDAACIRRILSFFHH